MNAMVREKYEVSVVAKDTLELHIAPLRQGLDDLKKDLREVRAEGKSLREKLDVVYVTLRDKIDQVQATLTAKIDQLNIRLDDKIDQSHNSLNAKLEKLSSDVSDLRSLQKGMLWVIGGVGSLATILVTIGKVLRWF